jgi:UDP-3-O-[3-hydroxymyristoyl] N-acetylglucosamine deacetylase
LTRPAPPEDPLREALLFQQTTLGGSVRVSGVGIHTGAKAQVTLHPADPHTGIVFHAGGATFPASAACVVSARRCTSLGTAEVRVDTVEHLLSALRGLRVDNARIEVEGPELPILDGSALPWVEAIQSVGIVPQEAQGRPLTISQTVALREGDTWLVAAPSDRFTLTCVTDFDHPLLGRQADTFEDDPACYAAGIAPARTFGFIGEVQALLDSGLAQGGTLENALIIYADRFSQPLRVPDECLRHKALDLWGDLSLAGSRLCAAVTAIRPGHRANVAFASLLRREAQRVNEE